MKLFFRLLLILSLAAPVLTGCSLINTPAAPENSPPTFIPTSIVSGPGTGSPASGLTPAVLEPAEARRRTLASLQKVDDFPLYTMTFYGDYNDLAMPATPVQGGEALSLNPSWGCTLFAALGDQGSKFYGRNFDWEFSPALLLFTHPAGSYASVSMVDLAYLIDVRDANRLVDLALEDRQALLDAPYLPFDGMNEAGVAIGMAAVPAGNVASDPAKKTIGSIRVIREVLDHAGSVDEAAAIFQKYNLNWGTGPAMHFMIADRSGQALLVEYSGNKLAMIRNTDPWFQATNFLVDQAGDRPEEMCSRYQKVSQRLTESKGRLTVAESMKLLSEVAQNNSSSSTQWSVVYGINTGEVYVVMGRQFERALFKFSIGESLD
jgi:hypothetical protein